MQDLNTELFLYLHGFSAYHPEVWLFLAGWFGLVIAVAMTLFTGLHKHGFKSIFREFIQHLEEWRSLLFIPLGSWAVAGFLKLIFAHPRPYEALIINPLSMPGSFDSFPSGHATFYMALALAVYQHHKKAGVFFILLSALLAVARIITGVHYPIDILGGWLVAYLMYRLVDGRK